VAWRAVEDEGCIAMNAVGDFDLDPYALLARTDWDGMYIT
jgi:hypothetical protein